MSVYDYLSVIPQLLVWTARRLESIWFIPWPLWVGSLFPVYLGVIYFILWFRRGSVWLVKCAYPKTERNRPCKNPVAGEWYKCRHHNKVRTYKSGHTVDPTINRWEKFDCNDRKVPSGACGKGLFWDKPAKKTLLFYDGFARRPRQALTAICEETCKLVSRVRTMKLRAPVEAEAPTLKKRESVEGRDVTEGLLSVIQATRFTLVAFLVALLATGVAVLLPATPRAMTQWAAILGFILAWAAISRGIYQKKEDWLGGTCLAALKWWAWTFVPVAAVGLVFGSP
ncbi:MAG: hypothetical protein ACRDRY_10315 [Pseudonocardiaceae bacterium]